MTSERSFVVTLRKEGPDLRVELTRARMHKMAGRTIDEARSEHLGRLAAMPAIHIGEYGELRGLADFDRYVANRVASRMGPKDAVAERAMRAAMSAPAARRSVAYHATASWRGWFGFWAGGEDPRRGRRTLALPLASGKTARIPFSVATEERPGRRVVFRASLDKSRGAGAIVAAYTTALRDHLLQKWGTPATEELADVDVLYQVTLEQARDGTGSRVVETGYEETLRYSNGHTDLIRMESRFDWGRARGCRRPWRQQD